MKKVFYLKCAAGEPKVGFRRLFSIAPQASSDQDCVHSHAWILRFSNRFSTKILKILEYSAPYIKILACSEIQKLATSTLEGVE